MILYMAISANGYIAKDNDETPWSDEEWHEFNKKVNEIGNVLIGRRTFELMKEDGSLGEFPCKLIMVLTNRTRKKVGRKTVFVSSLTDALETAKDYGFTQLLVCGGSKTVATVLNSGKANEVYLDVEPWIFSNGLPLADRLSHDLKLNLIGTKQIGKDGVQLHYKIRK